MKRIELAFNNFDNVLVAFSGGKDSGICLNLCYKYAKENNKLNKLYVYHQDYEAGYLQTFDYVKKQFDLMPELKKFWLCQHIKASCSVSMSQTYWTPWNKKEKDLWVRKMPSEEYVVNEDNCFYDFRNGTKGFNARIDFGYEFAEKYGNTALIVGLRADESLSRLAIITSNKRRHMYKDYRYTKQVSEKVYNFYPIYDWTTEDVWIANAKLGFLYNELYDLYYMAGLSIHEMRTASPFHHSGQKYLKAYKAICPDMWGKMISRVNGVNFAGLYGGTTAMGWQKIQKPEHFTWKEYAQFLIKTLPEKTKDRLIYHLNRLNQTWREKGYGRNPNVIKIMDDEGVELEKTGMDDPKCTKEGYYEIVKMKSDFPDETKIPMFRKCPNWKGVCITILKNDFSLTYMGCSRTKDEMNRRRKVLDKYKNL